MKILALLGMLALPLFPMLQGCESSPKPDISVKDQLEKATKLILKFKELRETLLQIPDIKEKISPEKMEEVEKKIDDALFVLHKAAIGAKMLETHDWVRLLGLALELKAFIEEAK